MVVVPVVTGICGSEFTPGLAHHLPAAVQGQTRHQGRHGHLMGDKVLAEVGHLLTLTTRNVDTVCRWGGEEFVVICHETPLGQAEMLAERLLQKTRAHPFPTYRMLTLSAGVAHVQPGDVPDTLVARADEALYSAKRNGRNRVCVAAPVVPPPVAGGDA